MYNFLLLSTSILCAKFLDFFSLFYLILEIFTFKKEDFLSLSARSRREGHSVGKNLEGIEQSLEDGSRNRTHNQGITRPRMKPLHHEDKVAMSINFCGFYSACHTRREKQLSLRDLFCELRRFLYFTKKLMIVTSNQHILIDKERDLF